MEPSDKDLKTFDAKSAPRHSQDFHNLLALSEDKIIEVLKLIDFGRALPEIWNEHREPEIEEKIVKICKVDKKVSQSIITSILHTIRRVNKKGFISNRASDFKKLGFEQSQIDKFVNIAKILQKEKTADHVKRSICGNLSRGKYCQI